MVKYEEIKRKHTRFPAFSDEAGVKLQSKRHHADYSAEDNWIITEEKPVLYAHREQNNPGRSLRRSSRVSQEKAGQSIQQKEELKRHRKNLPDYTKRYQSDSAVTGKKKLFGDSSAQSTFKVKEKRSEPMVISEKKSDYTRSYFVPKYIPASMIPDEQPNSSASREQLLASMTKDSYLLFDTEPAAYQERKDEDPAVQKFKQQEVKMTRSQYRETAKQEKKRSVLDQSLEGMITDGTYEPNAGKGYFKN